MKKRYIFVVLGHIACFLIYAHRFVFSVAIVVMVGRKSQRIQHETECPNNSVSFNASVVHPTYEGESNWEKKQGIVSSTTNEGEFKWSEKQQGFILSSFYHGYIPTLALSSLVLTKWRAKYIFGIGILLCSVLTALTPLAARSDFVLLYVVRFLIGK